MKHVDILFVLGVYVSAICHEELNYVEVSMECCEMEGSEPFITPANSVYPVFELLLSRFLLMLIMHCCVFSQYL